MTNRITGNWKTLAAALLLLACAGCDKQPPQAAEAVETGPPTVTHVDPESPAGKALAAASQLPHDNFVPRKKAIPPAALEKPAPGPTPKNENKQPSTKEPAPQPARPATPAATPGGNNAAPPADGVNRVTAESQTGRRAAEYGPGLITTPIGAYFSSKDKIAVAIQLKSELQVYATINGPPRNFDELTEKVIKPAHIKLPELRAGERYVFDPKQGPYGTLMIEQPATAAK